MMAAFFDRDGTINVNYGHVYRTQDLTFIEGVPEIIKSYNDARIPVIVVTNQAGIAKGLYTVEDMHRFNAHMNEQLRVRFGAHIDAFYFCPHHPDYTGPCGCRKPAPGLLLRAARDWNISLKDSVMYGDKKSDETAAARAGIADFRYIMSPDSRLKTRGK